jgi:hypothetical protein
MPATVHNVASSWSGSTDSANGDRVNFSNFHGQAQVSHDDTSGTVTVNGNVLAPGDSAIVNLGTQRSLAVALDDNGFPFETADPAETIAANVAQSITDEFGWDTAACGVLVTSSANLDVTVTGV